jgi:hypothetical protein
MFFTASNNLPDTASPGTKYNSACVANLRLIHQPIQIQPGYFGSDLILERYRTGSIASAMLRLQRHKQMLLYARTGRHHARRVWFVP